MSSQPDPLVRDLEALLGKEGVRADEETLERHSGDALGRFRAFRTASLLEKARPQVVVFPRSVEEVARVLSFASAHGVPVVPFGGGSGVMGGAVPVRGGIVLSLSRLGRVVEIDREGRRAVVEAGAILQDLAEALEREGLLLGHDPWSLPIATVGGAIATDGVGYLAARYGSMGDQVLGLEVVLPTGEVLATRGVPKGSGPALERLFIGSEGVLGVIVRATLEVFPQPEQRTVLAFSLPSFEAGFSAIMEVFALGLRPSLVDFAEELPQRDEAPGEVELYLAFEGPREVVEAGVGRTRSLLARSGARDLGPGAASYFWKTRHHLGERYKREILGKPRRRQVHSWPLDYLHLSLPASRVLEYRQFCREVLKGYGIPVREWSIWARPEFFSLLIAGGDAAGSPSWEAVGSAVDQLLQAGQALGGSMEYCHGVGLKLAHLMEGELGEGGMALLRRLKKALDPSGVLNPGKLGL